MTKYLEKKLSILLSFPLWGRGLKPLDLAQESLPIRRSPCGDVD